MKKRVAKKLSLNKLTISALNSEGLRVIKGGENTISEYAYFCGSNTGSGTGNDTGNPDTGGTGDPLPSETPTCYISCNDPCVGVTNGNEFACQTGGF